MMNRSKTAALLRRITRTRILVVGDLMLDRYVYGHVSRISPEAPVPVVRVTGQTDMPGGAGNVALNARALGASAQIAGLIGRDAHGRALRRTLEAERVDTRPTLALGRWPTIVKTRIVAERQQVVRIDEESALPPAQAIRTRRHRALREAVARAHAVILEDYGKGALDQETVDTVLDAARRRGLPVGVDPKDDHPLRFDGITVATPNRKEAFTLAGCPETEPCADPLRDRPLLRVAEALADRWHTRMLMITLGPHGMLLRMADRETFHVPTRAREVFDVSGAGDTVIAACMAALAAGADDRAAAEFANYAAGVVVGKLGTAVCRPDELLAYVPGK